jgi:uncharacterized NAD(P)/FAD-binding protein YdhS
MLNYQIPKLTLWTSIRKPSEIREALGEIHDAQIRLQVDMRHAVAQARKLGLSWEDIGDQVGMTRQSAWQRWHHLDPPDEKWPDDVW